MNRREKKRQHALQNEKQAMLNQNREPVTEMTVDHLRW